MSSNYQDKNLNFKLKIFAKFRGFFRKILHTDRRIFGQQELMPGVNTRNQKKFVLSRQFAPFST